MRTLILAVIIIAGQVSAVAQSTSYPVNPDQDILHYTFNITVNDSTNEISGLAMISFVLHDIDELILDLVNKDDDEKGMEVESVTFEGKDLDFSHVHDRLHIYWDLKLAGPQEIRIKYRGVPANGLIIADNKFGERVFFGDNYPDRARNWLPCVDHPSDKATVTWVVSAPKQYKVVASGKLVSKEPIENNYITTTWDEKVAISTKVMVFGAANFAIDQAGRMNEIPVSTWVYQQNKDAGFNDFAIAPKVLAFYDSLIAPYPYEKLANVQSKTTYGGMENAGNIFYYENSVTGDKKIENLIAHEIVHQWFGNSATELDWPHAWLSEGFATYLTHVYVGSRQGEAKMIEDLRKDRQQIIGYWKENPLPIVNYNLVSYPHIASLRELLSTNTYQKGGWVLHMLHAEIGDEVFWQSIRQYYIKHKNSVASTADLQRAFEEASGKNLQQFFQQWVYGLGQPVIAGKWDYKKGKIEIRITQTQEKPFVFPLEFGLVYGDKTIIKKLDVTSSMARISFSGKKPEKIIIDPMTKLLYEGSEVLTIVEDNTKPLNPTALNDIWVLSQFNGKVIQGSKVPVMELHLKSSKVLGNGGCNNYQGGFMLDDNKLIFATNIATTRMMCDNMAMEDAYLKAITGNKFAYEISNNRLYLLQNGKSVLVFKKVD